MPYSPCQAEPAAVRRVVMVGHVCIDENSGTGLPPAGERVAGSPAVFMNRYLRGAAEVEVAVLAPYGPDFLDVDSALPLLNGPTAERTLLYRNHLDGDQRTQECFDAALAHPVPVDAEAARALDAADLVIVCPLLPDLSAEYVASVLDGRGALSVLLAQGGFRRVDARGRVSRGSFADAERIIPLFDLVVFSDDDVDAPLETARRWSAAYPGTVVVVTQNRHGSTWFSGGVGTAVPARALRVPDGAAGNVIGTGDVFSAALALARLETGDVHAAVQCATAAAADFIDATRAGLHAPAAP
ncbi:MAG: PfkB family carbohydrate kinase [Herbiconiux sp.]|nr:PfkB family carbohydrate kinase [Herbiconiux sp.]